jgi:hypothetical protein
MRMTHSLHRCGNDESLRKDYVLLCTPAKGVNDQGAAEKLRRILDIVMDVGPCNIGFYGHGSLLTNVSIDEVKKKFHDNSRVRCCFDDREKLKEALKRIKNEDLGLSITVSGLISELKEISNELKIRPHTINVSCGIFGKVDRLPAKEVMEISTMCGHGMISFALVKDVVKRLLEGKLSYNEAIHQLGEPCTCGIFNPSRAHQILKDFIDSRRSQTAVLGRDSAEYDVTGVSCTR